MEFALRIEGFNQRLTDTLWYYQNEAHMHSSLQAAIYQVIYRFKRK